MVNKRQYVIYLSLLLSLISITVVIGGGVKIQKVTNGKGYLQLHLGQV